MRDVEYDWIAEGFHYLKAGEIVDQSVVAEECPALGQHDAGVAGAMRILSAALAISWGAMNCPFLILTILPLRPQAMSKSVWRARNAGTWSTSATCAAKGPAMSHAHR